MSHCGALPTCTCVVHREYYDTETWLLKQTAHLSNNGENDMFTLTPRKYQAMKNETSSPVSMEELEEYEKQLLTAEKQLLDSLDQVQSQHDRIAEVRSLLLAAMEKSVPSSQ